MSARDRERRPVHSSGSQHVMGMGIEEDLNNSIFGSSYPPSNIQSTSLLAGRISGQQGGMSRRTGGGGNVRFAADGNSVHQQRNPNRSTKLTTKLVLFPSDPADEQAHAMQQQDSATSSNFIPSQTTAPPSPDDAGGVTSAQSQAERLHKSARQAIPRVTSYCVAESFNFTPLVNYIKTSHGITPIKYDECLYFYYEGPFKESRFGIPSQKFYHIPLDRASSQTGGSAYANFPNLEADDILGRPLDSNIVPSTSATPPPGWLERGEVFIFDFGVIVLWNFSEVEEKAFLSHIKQFGVGRIKQEDMEIEDFHFQYDIAGPYQPRIFNDMITLKSSAPLIKLTISHGLSQSVKLSLFENIMEETISAAVPLPKQLAKFGVVKMSRTKIMKIIGNLYKLRMNVNLISNVLDTPDIFWSEPGLEGLYIAIRGYLEISQRAKLLNSRADVLADLLSMLSDHLNSSEMNYITWIVIILICGAVVVAGAEVVVKILRVRAGFSD